MIVRARWVVPITTNPISDGAVVIEGDSIKQVGSWEDMRHTATGNVLDLGEHILLPGMVNAHCHLDYSNMRSAISPQRTFTDWIRRINAIKRSTHPDDYATAIHAGYEELQRWGTTTVANIETFPELIARFTQPPVRTWWFLEMIDIRPRSTAEEILAKTSPWITSNPSAQMGLSPHAPYTASGDLFRLTNDLADTHNLPITTHVAESREEWQMFREGRGVLYSFMLQLGRWMNDAQQGRSPLAHVAAHTRLNQRWLLAHMNEIHDGDFALLQSLAANDRPSIVHCPGSHEYFQHSAFPLAPLRELGINICLGTDSLASTRSLSMFEEMRTLAKRHPELSGAEIVRMATYNGAVALRASTNIGQIAAGCFADLIAVPNIPDADDIYETIIKHRDPIRWRMLNGKIS